MLGVLSAFLYSFVQDEIGELKRQDWPVPFNVFSCSSGDFGINFQFLLFSYCCNQGWRIYNSQSTLRDISENKPNTSFPVLLLQQRQQYKSSLENNINIFFLTFLSVNGWKEKHMSWTRQNSKKSELSAKSCVIRRCSQNLVKSQKQLMAALFGSPVWKDKKDQLDGLIQHEINQQALCTVPARKIQSMKILLLPTF